LLHDSGRPLIEFSVYSADLANYFLPTSSNSIYKINDTLLLKSFGNPEGWTFLGFTVIFLAIIALIKIDKKEKIIWIISGSILGLISLGPFLRVFGIYTGIPLPVYFIYDFPGFEVFRAVGRAGLFVNFVVAILAANGINEIFKTISNSRRKKILVIIIIGFLVMLESLIIPFPTFALEEPSPLYHEIYSDSRDMVLLEAPIGLRLLKEQPIPDVLLINYHLTSQLVHEKPIYSGFEMRATSDNSNSNYVRTYFLNYFILDQPVQDIVKQDLKKVGISLFNYFNIKYVIIYENSSIYKKMVDPNLTNEWINQTRLLLFDIFSKPPDYIDDKIFSYKIPESNSTIPFLVLGDGWSSFRNDVRTTSDQAEIKIINPTDETSEINLEIDASSLVPNKVTLLFNNQIISKFEMDENFTYSISTGILKLNPNENILKIVVENLVIPYHIIDGKILHVTHAMDYVNNPIGLVVHKINTSSNTEDFIINKIESDPHKQRILTEIEINKLFNIHLKRNVLVGEELENLSNNVLNGNMNLTDVENYLKQTYEYIVIN